jgi:hypothetical protein
MDRTKELERAGARRIDKGINAPFIKWGDDPSWVEGRIIRFWESEYGLVATVEVTGAENARGTVGGESGEIVDIVTGDIANLGLQYAGIRDAISADHLGHSVHVAFTEWGKTKKGQKFRQFVVFDLGSASGGLPDAAPTEPEEEPEYISRPQAAELWVQAQEIDWGNVTPEQGLKSIIAKLQKIDVADVRLDRITVAELPKIQEQLDEKPAKDDLPF